MFSKKGSCCEASRRSTGQPGTIFNSHTGVLRAISLHFVKTGRLEQRYGRDLNWLAELRQIADYGELRNVAKTDAEQAFETAERFFRQVWQLLNTDR